MVDTQKFSKAEADASNAAVESIRGIIDQLPIAVAVSAVDIVRDDVHRQLQYGRAQFGIS
jgi:hypothetical protein